MMRRSYASSRPTRCYHAWLLLFLLYWIDATQGQTLTSVLSPQGDYLISGPAYSATFAYTRLVTLGTNPLISSNDTGIFSLSAGGTLQVNTPAVSGNGTITLISGNAPSAVLTIASTPNCFRHTADGTRLWSVKSAQTWSMVVASNGSVYTTPAYNGSPVPSCLDLAPGGQSGLLAMLDSSNSLSLFIKGSPDGSLKSWRNITMGASALSIAEEPIQSDYTKMRYYVGNTDGTITVLVADVTAGTVTSSSLDVKPFGYTLSYAGASYPILALACANHTLHVGGIQFYTVLDTTDPANIGMANNVIWNADANLNGNITSIRVPNSADGVQSAYLSSSITTAWFWTSSAACQLSSISQIASSILTSANGVALLVSGTGTSKFFITSKPPACPAQPTCNLTTVTNQTAFFSGETPFGLACSGYRYGQLRIDAVPSWRLSQPTSFTLNSTALNNFTVTVNALLKTSPGTLMNVANATYYLPIRSTAVLVDQLSTTANNTNATLLILSAVASAVAQNASALTSTQLTSAVSALTTVAGAANQTSTTVSTAISVLNTFVNTNTSASYVANYSSTILSLASAAVTVNATTQNCISLVDSAGTIANSTVQPTDSTKLIAALQKTSVAALAAAQNASLVLTSSNGVVTMSTLSTQSLDLSQGIIFQSAYFADPSRALNTIVQPGQQVVTQLLRINKDIYRNALSDGSGRSQYVTFSLLDNTGTEIPVSNLAQNLTVGIPLAGAYAYATGLNITNSSILCQYYDTIASVWATSGCAYDTLRSNTTMVFCQCNHLTTFSAEFDALSFAPRAITSRALIGLFDNYPVIFSCAAYLLLMLLCMFSAHRYDRRYRLSQEFGTAATAILPTLYEMRITNGDVMLHHVTLTLHNQSITETYQLAGPLHARNTRVYRLRGPDIGGITMATVSVLAHQKNQKLDATTSLATVQGLQIVNTRNQMKHDFAAFVLELGGKPTCIQPTVSSFLFNSYYERFCNLLRQNMPDRHAYISIGYRHKGSAFSSMERTMVLFLLLAANAACGLAWFRGQVNASAGVTFVYKLILAIMTGSIVFAGTFPLTLLFRQAKTFGPIASASGAIMTATMPLELKPTMGAKYFAAKRASAKLDSLEKHRNQMPRKSGIMRRLMPLTEQWSVGWRYVAWTLTLTLIVGSTAVCALLMNDMSQGEDTGILKVWAQSFALSLLQGIVLTQPLTVIVVSGWRARHEPDQDDVQRMVEEDVLHTKMSAAAIGATNHSFGNTLLGTSILTTREMSILSSGNTLASPEARSHHALLSPLTSPSSPASLLPTFTAAQSMSRYEQISSLKPSLHPMATQIDSPTSMSHLHTMQGS